MFHLKQVRKFPKSSVRILKDREKVGLRAEDGLVEEAAEVFPAGEEVSAAAEVRAVGRVI